MLNPKFFRHSCYKLMFFIGLVDILVCPCIIITGIQCAFGWHFCYSPKLFFLVGCIENSKKFLCFVTLFLAGWNIVCTLCIILGINRLVYTSFPSWKIFDGYKIFVWMAIPILDMCYVMSQQSIFYNNEYFSDFLDPFFGISGFETELQVSKKESIKCK